MYAAWTMALGIGSFGDLSSEFSDQLPDHLQQVKRFRNLGGSLQVLELVCIKFLLLSWRCPQSRERHLL